MAQTYINFVRVFVVMAFLWVGALFGCGGGIQQLPGPTPPVPPTPTYQAPTIVPVAGMRGWVEMTLPSDVTSADVTDFQGSVGGSDDESLGNQGCTGNVCQLVFPGLRINGSYAVTARYMVGEAASDASNEAVLDTTLTVSQYESPAGTLGFAEQFAYGNMNDDGYPDFIARGRSGTDSLLLMGGENFPALSATYAGLHNSFGDDFAFGDVDGDGLDNPVIGERWNAATMRGHVYVFDEADQGGTINAGDALLSLSDDTDNAECGGSFAALDDGNGIADLVIGAGNWDGLTLFGRVYSVDGPLSAAVLLDASNAIRTGEAGGDHAGWRVYRAGNVTGASGGADVALYIRRISGNDHTFALSNAGTFVTLSHDAGAASINGGSIGDMNGDGRDEFVLTTWQLPTKKFYIFYDYQDATKRYEIDFNDADCGQGFDGGDYYGTGERQLLVSCPADGKVYIYDRTVLGTEPSAPTAIAAATDELDIAAFAISIVDVNRDTYSDLVIGVPTLGLFGGMQVYK